MAESLVKGGSEVDVRAKDGLRPVQLADSNGHEEIVEWLVGIEGARPPDYECRSGWGVVSYIKDLITGGWDLGVLGVFL